MKEVIPDLFDIDELGPAVHAYLWRWEGGLTLIDTGLPGAKNRETILRGIHQLGFRPADLRRILLTHMDVDHAGNLKALKRASGAELACHAVEKQFLEHPNRRRPAPTLLGLLMHPLYRLVGALPYFRVQPIAPDRLLVDGDRLPEGFTVVHTPGHTPGHISLFHPQHRLLISGDALNHWGSRISPPPAIFTPDMNTAHRSIWKLAQKYSSNIDTIVFGHGPPIVGNGGAEIQALVDRIFGGSER